MTPSAVGKLVAKWRGVTVGESSHGHLRKLTATEADVAHVCADELEAALATAPPEQAARRYAEAWIVLQNGRVHSVHATREHANLENGEHLIMPETPWAILGSEQATTVANIQMSTTEQGSFDSVNTQPQAVSAGALSGPDGYAFRYPDGIRFTTGEAINGSRPLDSIPYYFESSLAAHDQKVRAEVLEEAANEAKKYGLGHEGDSIAAAIRRLKFPEAK